MSIRYGENALVGQSGGPTAAINASLAGVISAWLGKSDAGTLYGMANGIDGILSERLYDLGALFKGKEEDLDILKLTPGAALGSCRIKLPEPGGDPEFYEKLFGLFEKYGIGYFFYIGGNDSMDTAAKLSRYACEKGIDLRTVGVPKTVDNDLLGTDHTPGFGSAAKFVSTVFAELRRDTAVYRQKCVTVVEVMGRDAGWLTAASVLARTEHSEGPDLVYLPEVPFDHDRAFADIEKAWDDHPDVLIAVSEGIRLTDGTYVGADSAALDKFGHVQLSGAAAVLAARIKERFGCKVRSVELNTPQRCGAHIASLTDITEAFGVGAFGVGAARSGKTGIMTGIVRKDTDGAYASGYDAFDVSEIANKVKAFPPEFITPDGNDISEAGIRYLRPLIAGECGVKYRDGVPVHYVFEELK